MSIDKQRIYYNALFGALGGLISWLLIGLFLNIDISNLLMLFLKDALLGATVGICIGGAIGAVDGLTVSHSWRRLARGVFLGSIIGLVGGLIGLVIGEVIFKFAGGGVWPRAAGWAIFGFLVGTSEGRVQRSTAKTSYGAVGGLLGGLIGGSTYERLSTLLRAVTHDRELSLTVGSAVGLIILGACIGSLIGLVEDILRTAWLKVVVGRLEGRTFTLTRQETRLGKADDCDVVLPGDEDIYPHHAVIEQTQKTFVLRPLADPVLVNKQPMGQSHLLKHGDRIQLGKTQVIFNLEGGQK